MSIDKKITVIISAVDQYSGAMGAFSGGLKMAGRNKDFTVKKIRLVCLEILIVEKKKVDLEKIFIKENTRIIYDTISKNKDITISKLSDKIANELSWEELGPKYAELFKRVVQNKNVDLHLFLNY